MKFVILGYIVFDHKLTFKAHIDYAVSKAFRKLYFIQRKAKGFKNVQSMVVLYNSLVLLIMLYASPVWRPYFQTDLRKFDKVQHFFFRIAAIKEGRPVLWCDHDFSGIAERLGVNSVDSKFDYFDLMFLFKIINNFFDSPSLLSCVNFHVAMRFTRNNRLFHIPISMRNWMDRSVIMSRIRRIGKNILLMLIFSICLFPLLNN